jgi:vanillate O-demethylase monooxygenase subunit
MSQPGQSTPHAAFRHFPLNAWYAAAWDHEVGRNLLAKTIAGKPIVFYRTTEGRPVALADACWHRLAPLSMGKLRGADEIQCGYHGICYDADGRATFMPAQETINPSATVHSYPVVERHRYVWVWPGDPAWPIPTSCPTCTGTTTPSGPVTGKTIHVNCSYQLIVDNLMDLTHEQFVHGSSIGHDSLSESDFEVTHDDRTVTGHEVDDGHRPAAVLEAQPAGPVPRLRGPRRPVADHPLHRPVDGRPSTWASRRRAPGPWTATAARASPAP